MRKLMKILSFAASGIIGISAMAVVLCWVFRVPLMELLFHRGEELPAVLPVADAISLAGQMGAMIWLCICMCNRRFGIWAELLTVGWLGAVLPGACQVSAYLQNVLLGRAMGTEYLIACSSMSNLWSYATVFNGVAVSMALVICGLSMADKKCDRR